LNLPDERMPTSSFAPQIPASMDSGSIYQENNDSQPNIPMHENNLNMGVQRDNMMQNNE